MNAIWLSLKGNMNCGRKIADVARQPEKMVRRQNNTSLEETSLGSELTENKEEVPLILHKFRHYYIRHWYHELGTGDPSRNVIEMIFRASSNNPNKCSKKIKRVLKVNNPQDIIAKFERYRETVMISSNKQHKRHPRSIVDGNESLQFYGTTMGCCGGVSRPVSELCRDPTCRLCRIIQSGFNTWYNKIYGIRLSKNSEQMSEDMTSIAKSKNVKKAVIICRTIAGGTVGKEGEECEQVGFCTKPETIIVRDPTAVLPCFVIVLD